MAAENMQCASFFNPCESLIGNEDPIKANMIVSVTVIGYKEWLPIIDQDIGSDC